MTFNPSLKRFPTNKFQNGACVNIPYKWYGQIEIYQRLLTIVDTKTSACRKDKPIYRDIHQFQLLLCRIAKLGL